MVGTLLGQSKFLKSTLKASHRSTLSRLPGRALPALVRKGGSQPRRATLDVVRRAFEKAGVEFIDENGGGPGVRLRKPPKQKR